MTSKQLARADRLERRNKQMQDAFYKRYTNQPRVNGARIYTREGVVAQLAEEYHLSMATVEKIVLPKTQ